MPHRIRTGTARGSGNDDILRAVIEHAVGARPAGGTRMMVPADHRVAPGETPRTWQAQLPALTAPFAAITTYSVPWSEAWNPEPGWIVTLWLPPLTAAVTE